jgi:hypothetical protein
MLKLFGNWNLRVLAEDRRRMSESVCMLCMHAWTVASLQRPFGGMLMDVVEESTNMRRNRHAMLLQVSMK